ncbi:MAG TPA: class I SAM-dependent methyltransferase, partial [Methyloceanibacter sp.]|nr:class I SAM-dependent methyltransferase [Methyloceanibacter sp.]
MRRWPLCCIPAATRVRTGPRSIAILRFSPRLPRPHPTHDAFFRWCSSGEECVTLAEYFPKAEIVGADINPVILLQARKRRSDRIRFVYASDRILSGLGGFDAIFCMAVLRSAGHYPFEIYEERALFLETLLRPGGLLVIHNSPYRFGDTARKYSYETIPV